MHWRVCPNEETSRDSRLPRFTSQRRRTESSVYHRLLSGEKKKKKKKHTSTPRLLGRPAVENCHSQIPQDVSAKRQISLLPIGRQDIPRLGVRCRRWSKPIGGIPAQLSQIAKGLLLFGAAMSCPALGESPQPMKSDTGSVPTTLPVSYQPRVRPAEMLGKLAIWHLRVSCDRSYTVLRAVLLRSSRGRRWRTTPGISLDEDYGRF